MEPIKMTAVINGKRYRTETAKLIAHDAYWDGSNFERRGRNTFLFVTPRGNYFAQYQTLWQDELDRLVPLTPEEAVELYQELPVHVIPFEEAFPNIKVEDA